MSRYDVVVIGLGHAGCEAALATAKMGLKTAGVTLRLSRAAVMSCNPAIGGTAKGHLVKELDALGGRMAEVADRAGTHFVTLNASKGPAVRATRVLCDRDAYAAAMQEELRRAPKLDLIEGEVHEIVVEGDTVRGVRLADGRALEATAVVVTTGTFLQAVLHCGLRQEVGGRLGDAAASGLSNALRTLGFVLGRFKTGTPARLRKRSIDWSKCVRQPSLEAPRPFSRRTEGGFLNGRALVDCYVTHTTESTHQIVRENLGQSPLFQGRIEGRGPRYCPSLEDKVHRFGHRPRHTVFLEPEGIVSDLVYPAGLSTSLPADVQWAMLRSIPGLEAVEVERFGYAVEYDYALPTQLSRSLETRLYRGLFFAGQLNGTSGYEEAAVQGLLAGINAARLVQGRLPLILQRHEAHAAVLIDELTTHGVDEPFRMMTSRSEHRLRLREGTAGWRLTPHGFEVGLVSPAELQRTLQHRSAVEGELARLDARGHLARLRVPMATWATVTEGDISRPVLSDEVIEAVEIEAKYAPYIEQADEALERQGSAFARLRVPPGFDFSSIVGLSNEARERLAKAQPATFEDVQRLRGITPASAALVLAHLRRAVSRETGTCVSRRPNVAEAL